jgi:hypothetical protein
LLPHIGDEYEAHWRSYRGLRVPFRALPIPGFERDDVKIQLGQFIHDLQDPRVKIDVRYKVLIAPAELVNRANEFMATLPTDLKDDEEWCCCLSVCDDPDSPTLTNFPLSIFREGGVVQTRKMCRMCMAESLSYATGAWFDGVSINKKVLAALKTKPTPIPAESSSVSAGGEFWPQVPLGSMLLALYSDTDQMKGLVRAWVLGVFWAAAHTAQDVIAVCPDHPETMILLTDKTKRKPTHCRVLSCFLARCPKCCQWHRADMMCEKSELQQCPKCQTPTWKDGGCNHISCPCGCHWCYLCGAGYKAGGEVYAHMTDKHGNWWEEL